MNPFLKRFFGYTLVWLSGTNIVFAQVPPFLHNKAYSRPSADAPMAKWSVIKTSTHQSDDQGEDPSQYIDRAGSTIRGEFKGVKFTIRYIPPPPKTYEFGTLLLTIGKAKYLFTKICTTWRLEWAGDSDGDGKLDLIIGSIDESGAERSDLFLSSIAPKGKLILHATTLAIEEGC